MPITLCENCNCEYNPDTVCENCSQHENCTGDCDGFFCQDCCKLDFEDMNYYTYGDSYDEMDDPYEGEDSDLLNEW